MDFDWITVMPNLSKSATIRYGCATCGADLDIRLSETDLFHNTRILIVIFIVVVLVVQSPSSTLNVAMPKADAIKCSKV